MSQTIISRRRFLADALVKASLVGLIGCNSSKPAPTGSAPPRSRADQIDQELRAAAKFLLGKQAPDGAWRSEVYGPFKDGGSLTPLVLLALSRIPPAADVDFTEHKRKGTAYLAGMVKQDGTIDPGEHGISYPVYTAAGAVRLLPAGEAAQAGWLKYLRERQLNEALGWDPADKEYGGWGYCPRLPRKPKPGEERAPLTESNLSATLAALEALGAITIGPDDPTYAQALVFVKRCQNIERKVKDEDIDGHLNDGGFHFIYDDPVRNKGGAAGKDSLGHERFHSYGSMTAEGLRALKLCGLADDDHHVFDAKDWLLNHFRADSHPGKYTEAREPQREAVYFYYCASVSQALRGAGVKEIKGKTATVRWAEAIADELLKRQRPDGSWASTLVAQREDDPLVATSLAITGLTECRRDLRA